MRNELMNEPASDEKSEQKTTKTEYHKIGMMEGFFSRKKFVFLNIIDDEDEFENNQKY